MGERMRLSRPIEDAAGSGEIIEITIKDEKDVSAIDFYGISFGADGKSELGSLAGTIANLTGLTDNQVALLSVKDYMKLNAKVAKPTVKEQWRLLKWQELYRSLGGVS